MQHPNISKHSGSIPSSEALPIYYDFYRPEENISDPLPLVIFVHGFKGFKDWGAFPDACAELAGAGFGVLAMNFSLNGVGRSMTDFDELDLFARETLSQDLDDIGSVLGALEDGTFSTGKATIRTKDIGIIGHSRGGHTAVTAAAEYPEITCLVTWSAVADYNEQWSDKMIEDWEGNGVTEIMNGRTGQIMLVKEVVYHDALRNASRLMAVRRIKELNIPALFIHSKGDESVPYSEAEKLYNNSPSEHKELKLIPDSGHTFGTAHPFHENTFPEPFQQVVTATTQWFKKYLQ